MTVVDVQVVDVQTTLGVARFHVSRCEAHVTPRALVVLGHGAGGGVEARDLTTLSEGLPAAGFDVVLVEQPWRVAGRKVAPAPARLDAAFIETAPQLDRFRRGDAPLVVGGRSAGARVACRTSAAVHAAAVLALAFPLHPPGRPDKSRMNELATGRPTLVVQGDRDPFGGPDEFHDAPHEVVVTAIAEADHGFHVRASGSITTAEATELILARTIAWLRGNPWR